MKELGYLYSPEQYAQPDDSCMLEDSTIAHAFFADFYGDDGKVFLGELTLANLKMKFMPAWVYYLPKSEKNIAIVPIFRINNPAISQTFTIVKCKILHEETYFYWNSKLHAATFTSTGELAIRGIRAILSIQDMRFVAEMDEKRQIEEIYPVKLYDGRDGKFLAVCWRLETQTAYWYETVCSDDDEFMDRIPVNEVISYPINIGETVIIGGYFYICAYDKDFLTHFEKMPFKASEQDIMKEHIILPPKKTEASPKVKMKVLLCNKQEKRQEQTSKIISFEPKIQ